MRGRKGGYEVDQGGESVLSKIIDITHDAIVSVDQDQNIILFNKSAEDIFGYRASEVSGKSLDLLMPDIFSLMHRKPVD